MHSVRAVAGAAGCVRELRIACPRLPGEGDRAIATMLDQGVKMPQWAITALLVFTFVVLPIVGLIVKSLNRRGREHASGRCWGTRTPNDSRGDFHVRHGAK
jgi:hypothetical protein